MDQEAERFKRQQESVEGKWGARTMEEIQKRAAELKKEEEFEKYQDSEERIEGLLSSGTKEEIEKLIMMNEKAIEEQEAKLKKDRAFLEKLRVRNNER